MLLVTKVRDFLTRDINELLVYSTPKTVRIRDKRLCCGWTLILLAIFGYIVVYEVIFNQGYLSRDAPLGVSRTSYRDPASLGMTVAPSVYCGNASTVGYNYSSLPCITWDYIDAVVPVAEEYSSFLTTRAKFTTTVSTKGTAPCTVLNVANCTSQISSTDTPVYVNNIEDYSILLQHSLYGNTNTMVSQTQMSMGQLYYQHTDTVVKNFVLEQGPTRNGDMLLVSDLLHSAGITLDDPSTSSPGETLRYSGVTLLLHIEYANRLSPLNALTYKMYVTQVPDVEYDVEQSLWNEDATSVTRTVVDRHGIRLIVIQGGHVGKFSLMELLKTLVTAFVLMGIAQFVVERLLLQLMPLRRVLQAYKYLDTVNISDVSRPEKDRYMIKRTAGEFDLETHDFAYGTMLRGGHDTERCWATGVLPTCERRQEGSDSRNGGKYHPIAYTERSVESKQSRRDDGKHRVKFSECEADAEEAQETGMDTEYSPVYGDTFNEAEHDGHGSPLNITHEGNGITHMVPPPDTMKVIGQYSPTTLANQGSSPTDVSHRAQYIAAASQPSAYRSAYYGHQTYPYYR